MVAQLGAVQKVWPDFLSILIGIALFVLTFSIDLKGVQQFFLKMCDPIFRVSNIFFLVVFRDAILEHLNTYLRSHL